MAWIWGNENAHLLLGKAQTGAASMEISVEVPQEARNRSTR